VAGARPFVEEALAIQRRLAPDRPEIGQTLVTAGVVYLGLGNYPAAERAFREAQVTFTRFGTLTAEGLGMVLTNLGGLYVEMGDLDRAGDVLQQAVEHMRRVHGDRHPRYATSLLNLASWHNKNHRPAEAVPLIRECVEIREETLGVNHPLYFHALHNLAVNLIECGEVDAARPVADRALAGRQAFGEDHPLATHALGTRSRIDVLDGRPRDALDRRRESTAIERRVIGRVFAATSDAERLAYLDTVRRRLFYFLSLVHSHLRDDRRAVADALDLVLTRKALTAEATAARRDAVLGGRYPHLAPQLAELSDLRRRIAARLLAGPGAAGLNDHRRLLDGWRKRQAVLEVELARAIPEVGLEQRLREADHTAVAAALPAGAALVEFVRFDLFDFRAVPARGETQWKPARYAAFVLREWDVGDVRMIDLGEADEIDRRIRAFRSEVTRDPGAGTRGMVVFDDDEPAAEMAGPGLTLRGVLLDPLRDAIAGAGHLILAVDGELATLPFEVLPGPDGRPLVESVRLSYLAVGRDLLRGGAAGRASAPLVVAGPDFDLGGMPGPARPPEAAALSRDLDRSALRFPPLPGAAEEGRRVAAMLGVEPALGPEAAEGRVGACVSPRVVHLATHGFFLPDRPDSPDEATAARLRGGAPENPLLRSGLALAGANTWLSGGSTPPGVGDGLLTAEDVTGLDLLDTDLVVLSACETGLGEVKAGEGVFGLRRAFQLAGARTVVMSLWKVPDEATRELMASFYKHLLGGVPKAEALRRAQLELKTRYPDPRHWGAFILQGDTGALRTGPLAESAAASVASAPPEALPPSRPAGPNLPPATSSPTAVVYDVRTDRTVRGLGVNCRLWFGLGPLAILGLELWYFNSWPEAIVGFLSKNLLWAAIGIVHNWSSLVWLQDQRRCKRWRRSGVGDVAEGEVTGFAVLAADDVDPPAEGGVRFAVGGQEFTLVHPTRRGGFRLGAVPVPGQPLTPIRPGELLRVTHHDGRILRIDAAREDID
jgi:tetratricopeptide (TPR) repeat protein